jgi:hypothetical protein
MSDQAAQASQPLIVGWDTETHRIGPGKVFPPVVCLQTSVDGEWDVVARNETDRFDAAKASLFDPTADYIRVAHNSSFDLMVMAVVEDPSLLPAVFQMLEAGRLVCTKIREKLLNLTTHGSLTYREVGGVNTKIDYSLSDLVWQYFQTDIKGDKASVSRNIHTGEQKVVGDNDSWRLNFDALEDMPVKDWPREAVEYAASDAVWAAAVYEQQEAVRHEIIQNLGHDPFETLAFRCCADFALSLKTVLGVKTDPDRIAVIEEVLNEELDPSNMPLLVAEGIIRPAEAPRPYANDARNHVAGCTAKKGCDCPPKMTSGKKESVNTTKLRAYVERLHKARPDEVELKKTAPSDKFPEGQISTDAAWLEDHAHLDPLLGEYKARGELQKLVTTYIPQMKWDGVVAPVVHPCFDVLKETGRTSSHGSNLYPSFNCQQVDPRIRQGYIPRPGRLFYSIDYTAMELGTLAQTCLNLFGHSELARIINEGKDPHAYLAVQIALATDPDFRDAALDEIDLSDRDGAYDLFMSLKDDPDTKAYFKHYRTFAKPTGLGYPGGLGPDTFVAYAKATYKLDVSRDTAVSLREVWKSTFPEMNEFFNHINKSCIDEFNGPRKRLVKKKDPETGEVNLVEEWVDRYRYETPMGLHRMACDYCAACNGLGLQSPSAEGALLADYELAKACWLPGGELHGKVFPLMFIHDEEVGEIEIDTPERMTYLLSLASQIMVDSMRLVTPDVKASATPVLMTRWDKYVDPAYDNDGNLIAVDPDERN